MNVAVIVAGGSGERSGQEGGKQLALVAGKPVLSHTVAAFERAEAVDAIVVVAHPDRVEQYRAVAVTPIGAAKVIAIVPGGDTRQQSVARGLAAVPAEADIVLVHDGARPLVTPALIERAIDALADDASLDGIVVGHPSYDTLKVVDAAGTITATADRAAIWSAQTPQVFRARSLREAYARAEADAAEATDDASLVERVGGKVRMLAGPRENIKVTVHEDLLVVEQLLLARAQGGDR